MINIFRKICSLSTFFLIAILEVNCTKPEETLIEPATPAIVSEVEEVKTPATKPPPIIVGEENFAKIEAFINRKGFDVSRKDDLLINRQYTFFDSDGNRHAMITSKSGNPSVCSIFVWAYFHGIKDQKHFFGYCIERGGIYPTKILNTGGYDPRDLDAIRKGYEEFLKLVNHS